MSFLRGRDLGNKTSIKETWSLKLSGKGFRCSRMQRGRGFHDMPVDNKLAQKMSLALNDMCTRVKSKEGNDHQRKVDILEWSAFIATA